MKAFFSLVLVLIVAQFSFAQQEELEDVPQDTLGHSSPYALKLTKMTTGKTYYAQIGKTITVKFMGEKFRGAITDLAPDSITMGSRTISLNDIQFMRIMLPQTSGAGVGIMFLGLLTVGVGIVTGLAIATAGVILPPFIVIGAMITISGAVLGGIVFVSGIAILTSGKKFDVVKKWKAEVVPKPVK